MRIDIRQDDLTGPQVLGLLEAHLRHMRRITPRGSVHAHGPERLRELDVTFWSAWIADDIVGCAALKQLDAESGEVKSMHTVTSLRRRGIARALLEHVISQAEERGYAQPYLETGATEAFDAARSLYGRYGFVRCDPFGAYEDHPHSHFMVKRL